MNKNTIITAGVVVILIVGTVFLIGKKQTATAPSVSTQSSPIPVTQNAPTVDPKVPVKEFTMTAKQFTFEPATITVKQGDRVRIKIKSVDVAHSIAIPDFNINVDLAPDKEETVEFVADKPGTYTFFCSVFCGAGHPDMKGKLVVQ